MKKGIGALNSITDVVLAYRPDKEGKDARSITSKLCSEEGLITLIAALGADSVGNLSKPERVLLRKACALPKAPMREFKKRIKDGEDPLGEAFCAIRSADARRISGAVYTPYAVVQAMVGWAAKIGTPDRVIDPGTGSARFLLESGRNFPKAELIGIETDPLAALMARANLAAAGMTKRSTVRLEDFRTAHFDEIEGRTLYIGNPPYVRHHLINAEWKQWLRNEAKSMDLHASTLAGLHVYFFLSIAKRAKAGDHGALITAAEWLDVNYGKLVRDLFLDRLGGQAVYVIEPDAEPFPETQTTAAVTTFTVNGKPSSARFARINKLDDLDHLSGGRRVRRERLLTERRWSHFTRKQYNAPEGYIELGELCRVHRGQVTGANKIWIDGIHSAELPDGVKFPTVTKAMELIRSGIVLSDPTCLRRVIDLSVDLSDYSGEIRDAINRFLEIAEKMGAKTSYIATHRKAWWSVGLRDPAPILATYMARRPPTFVLNEADARHINIAHGLYPRARLKKRTLTSLVRYLRGSATLHGGRVYSGGLTKFEPREMERIPVPGPKLLDEIYA